MWNCRQGREHLGPSDALRPERRRQLGHGGRGGELVQPVQDGRGHPQGAGGEHGEGMYLFLNINFQATFYPYT